MPHHEPLKVVLAYLGSCATSMNGSHMKFASLARRGNLLFISRHLGQRLHGTLS